MIKKRLLVLLSIIFVISACSVTGPTIRSNYNHAIDFNQYKTFGFYQPLDTDSRYESLISQYLKEATIIEMKQRGFVLAKDAPDLLINFHHNVQSKQDIYNLSNNRTGYYSYRGRQYYDTWVGYDSFVNQYEEGTLNIDLVDRRQNKMVWEGVAVGTVGENELQHLKLSLQNNIHQIFAQFPR